MKLPVKCMVFVVSMVMCDSVNVCWSLRSGAFLEHHYSSFLKVDRQGPGLTVILQQIQAVLKPLFSGRGGPGHLRREDHFISVSCRVRP